MRSLIRGGEWRLRGRRQRAFALIEALVAVLIVSVTLLGIAQLLLSSLREAGYALARTQAVYLVADMMERIRANPDAGDAYDCASYPMGPVEHGCAPSGAPAVECTARELAEDDLARWQNLLRQTLPLPIADRCAANVAYFAGASMSEPPRYRVEVLWGKPGDEQPTTLAGDLLVASGPRS
jgi:type IV pilus assembly protein PilV